MRHRSKSIVSQHSLSDEFIQAIRLDSKYLQALFPKCYMCSPQKAISRHVRYLAIIVLQRGTRDTPNSMGAEGQRAEGKHKQTQATQDTPTRGRLQTHPHLLSHYRFSQRDGRKDPPAGNQARCNRTNTPQSEAEPNTPNPHTGCETQSLDR
jgi:hypothetical protein